MCSAVYAVCLSVCSAVTRWYNDVDVDADVDVEDTLVRAKRLFAILTVNAEWWTPSFFLHRIPGMDEITRSLASWYSYSRIVCCR